MQLSVRADFKGIHRSLSALEKQQAPYALALALTRTAQIAQRAVVQEIGRVFDRPTAYARGATRLIPATKSRLVATVFLKDRQSKVVSKASHFLYPQVFAGARDRKAFESALLAAGVIRSNEFVVPAEGCPRDAHGNVPVGIHRKILSQLKAAERTAGYQANRTGSARSRRTVAKAGTFFVPRPGGGLPRGIYQRVRTGFGWATRMVFKIVVGKPRYKRRLDLFGIADDVRRKHFRHEFETAMSHAIATAR